MTYSPVSTPAAPPRTTLRRHIAHWCTYAVLGVFATGSAVTIIGVAVLLIHHFSQPPAVGGGG